MKKQDNTSKQAALSETNEKIPPVNTSVSETAVLQTGKEQEKKEDLHDQKDENWVEDRQWFLDSCRQFVNSAFYKKAINDPNYSKDTAIQDFLVSYLTCDQTSRDTSISTDINPVDKDEIELVASTIRKRYYKAF